MKEKDTKQAIFETAVDLFSHQGYAGTSMREIACAVGIKESSIYNHYKNKEDILHSIFEHFRDELTAKRPSENETGKLIALLSPPDIFKLIFMRYGNTEDVIIDRIAKIIFSEQYSNPLARDFILNVEIREPIAYYESLLEEMARAGKMSEADYRSMAEELHYGFLGIIMEYSHVKMEGEYDRDTVQRLIRHVEFVFKQIIH